MSDASQPCWCGGTGLTPAAHPSYLACPACGSAALRAELMPRNATAVTDERADLYGEQYWDEHQAALGLPPLAERARTDLPGRCQYWLERILKFRPAAGRALEIGCSHGGFVKLLGLAGFAAAGMEISPSIVKAARDRFGITMHQGPLDAAPDLGTFDLIALFDVAEHLTDPVATMKQIADHLTPGGLLALQTPNHDDAAGAGWPMYQPPEHTYLYSTAGMRKLLAGAGLPEVAFVPALNAYDMFAFAARAPLVERSDTAIADDLMKTPNGRVVLAMQDLHRAGVNYPGRDLADGTATTRLAGATVRAAWRSVRRRLGLGGRPA